MPNRYRQRIADFANAKLEREAKVVYGSDDTAWYSTKDILQLKLTALLINIEPIEACTHPSEKISTTYLEYQNIGEVRHTFHCDCGARVKVKRDGYEVCE